MPFCIHCTLIALVDLRENQTLLHMSTGQELRHFWLLIFVGTTTSNGCYTVMMTQSSLSTMP